MKFTKMHGLGNDYICLNCMDAMPDDPAVLARGLSDRHFGVGGDGLVCICPSKTADVRMQMFNADGSEGAMCGNGIRCVGKYVYEKGLSNKTKLTVETQSGIRELELRLRNGAVTWVTVDMGVPEIGPMAKLHVNEKSYTGIAVSVGNLHFVTPVSEITQIDLAAVGPLLEHHPHFPEGVNVEFVRVLCRGRFEMRVWERGSGETMACGTGACAALAALSTLGRVGREVTVSLPGGELEVEWRERDGHLMMTGPAVTVFEGELYGQDQ